MVTPPNFVDADGDANNMDAYLWGELQYFIDLSMIYAKLPLAPFFCLRRVCKEWNRLASDRQFLEQNFKPPFSSNPYFVLPCANGRHALLTLEGSSWSSTPVPRMRYEVSGLLFDDFNDIRVFDLHTRVFHTLPPHEEKCDSNNPLFGMMVDTSLIPYGFRVIISDDYTTKTRVYDSNSGAWTVKLSTRPFHANYYASLATWGIHYNNSMYFEVDYYDHWYRFLIYDLEKDKWNFLKLWSQAYGWRSLHNDIDIWKDRWVFFGMNAWLIVSPKPKFNVWECIPKHKENPWNEFDCMPEDIYQWMEGLGYYQDYCKTKVYGEHVLIYNYMDGEKRAVLYNLDRKTWKKIELPASLML